MCDSFTAIDFETAHGKRWSICQVGLVRVEHKRIVKEISLLIQPPGNVYWYNFVRIHGITPKDTEQAPTFNQVWHVIEPYIRNQHVVAHNGFGFDFNVLEHTLGFYGIKAPEYEKHCTLKIYKKNLAALCEDYEIELNHHDALSDAMACARLFIMYLDKA
jgi:DNA polymerase III subunit epsilon